MPPDILALCYGTRPQVIKASVLRRELARVGRILAVDTGQHYDWELNALLYRQLEVEPADVTLDVGSDDHAAQTASVLTRAAATLAEHRPRAVVVIGYATLHRVELTDRRDLLLEVLDAFAALDLPVVLPLHPRTRAVLAAVRRHLEATEGASEWDRDAYGAGDAARRVAGSVAELLAT